MPNRYTPRRKELEAHYQVSSLNTLIADLYSKNKLSSIQISEKFQSEANISFTPRAIQRILKDNDIIRSKKESFNLSLESGRMKKHIGEWRKYLSPISSTKKFKVFEDHAYRCSTCGKNLNEVQHIRVLRIIPLEQGGDNSLKNLHLQCNICTPFKPTT